MNDNLSPTMLAALTHCRAAGGLKYVRGGFWIEVTQDPAPFLRLGHSPQTSRDAALPWHTTTHTIQALLRRGVVFEPPESRAHADYPTLVKVVAAEFAPTHVFVLHDGERVPVRAELRHDWIAWEADGTPWGTNKDVLAKEWVCTKRGVTSVAEVLAT